MLLSDVTKVFAKDLLVGLFETRAVWLQGEVVNVGTSWVDIFDTTATIRCTTSFCPSSVSVGDYVTVFGEIGDTDSAAATLSDVTVSAAKLVRAGTAAACSHNAAVWPLEVAWAALRRAEAKSSCPPRT